MSQYVAHLLSMEIYPTICYFFIKATLSTALVGSDSVQASADRYPWHKSACSSISLSILYMHPPTYTCVLTQAYMGMHTTHSHTDITINNSFVGICGESMQLHFILYLSKHSKQGLVAWWIRCNPQRKNITKKQKMCYKNTYVLLSWLHNLFISLKSEAHHYLPIIQHKWSFFPTGQYRMKALFECDRTICCLQLCAEAKPTLFCSAKVRYETHGFHVCTCGYDKSARGHTVVV